MWLIFYDMCIWFRVLSCRVLFQKSEKKLRCSVDVQGEELYVSIDMVLLCVCAWVCLVVSNFLQLHGLELSRLLCPWDFPGKNTSGLPFPPPGDLLYTPIEPESLVSPALAGGFFIVAPPGKPRFLLFFQVVNTECFYPLYLDNTTECKNYLFKHIYVCVL